MKALIPFQVYRSGAHEYLAVTAALGLRIEKGRLGAKLYRLTKAILLSKTTVKLIIEKPSREENSFAVTVKSAREHWKQIGMTGSLEARSDFYREVLALCGHFNAKTRANYTLREIARAIGIKSYATFYKVLALEGRRKLVGRKKAIDTSADRTIVQSVVNFRNIWSSLHGYSKRLDRIFEYELSLYTSAMKARSLRIS